jgi:hypothetical protein
LRKCHNGFCVQAGLAVQSKMTARNATPANLSASHLITPLFSICE